MRGNLGSSLVTADALGADNRGGTGVSSAATAKPTVPAVPAEKSAPGLPAAVAASSAARPAGQNFAFEGAVERNDLPPLLSFRADQPMLLASTAKLVTSLAALDLLGPQHRWRRRRSTAPVSEGRLRGDLVITGGPVGLTGNELRRWFLQLRREAC